MLYPLAETLRAALAHAPDALIPPGAREAISALADGLPDAMRGFGFECRLGERGGRVDFGASVAADDGGREILAAFDPGAGPGGPRFASAEWRAIRAFAARWADPGSALHDRVPMVFLEFDADRPAEQAPSLFVRMRAEAPGARETRGALPPAAAEALELLRGRPLAPETRAVLSACFEAMPAGGRVLDVAAMLSRPTEAVRLFASLPAARLSGYLAAIGWGSLERIADERLFDLYTHDDRVDLQLDMTDRVLPRIGVERSHGAGPSSAPRWGALLDRLVDRGLATPEMRSAFLGWPGRTLERLPSHGWPCVLQRMISHIKLVVAPSLPLEAKGYLWAIPTFAIAL